MKGAMALDIKQLQQIIDSAKEALRERKRLVKLHNGQIARVASGGMSRARTTTYNSAAGSAAERANFFEKDLKRLVLGLPEDV